MKNPWQVDSMEAFACLKCPECYFTSKQGDLFQDHAVQCHPLSHVLFGMIELEYNTDKEIQRYDQNDIQSYQYMNSSNRLDIQQDITETSSSDTNIEVLNYDPNNCLYGVSEMEIHTVGKETQINDQNCIEDYIHENSVTQTNFLKDIAGKFANIADSNDVQTHNFKKSDFINDMDENDAYELGMGALVRTAVPSQKLSDDVKENYSHVNQDSNLKCDLISNIETGDNKEDTFEENPSSYVKLQNWQFDAMTKELRDGVESWRMIADESPSNTALMKAARFEEFRKWINKLKPPEGKKLRKFDTRRLLRSRIYNWRKKCNDHQKKISTSEKPMQKWQGSWGILYDLFLVDKQKFEQNQNNEMETYSEINEDSPNFSLTTVYKAENNIQNSKKGRYVHERKKVWPCDICDISFRLQSNFIMHYVECLSKKENQVICGICALSFTYTKSLVKHLETTHKGKIYKEKCFNCNNCNSGFFGAKELKVHVLNAHLDGKLLPCPICNGTFKDIKILKQHLKAVHGEKKFNCLLCKAKYSLNQSLKNHIMSVHENTNPHKCSMCNFAAKLKDTLNRHIKSVHKEKKFKCHVCDAKFTAKSYLNNHTKYLCEGKKRTEK